MLQRRVASNKMLDRGPQGPGLGTPVLSSSCLNCFHLKYRMNTSVHIKHVLVRSKHSNLEEVDI